MPRRAPFLTLAPLLALATVAPLPAAAWDLAPRDIPQAAAPRPAACRTDAHGTEICFAYDGATLWAIVSLPPAGAPPPAPSRAGPGDSPDALSAKTLPVFQVDATAPIDLNRLYALEQRANIARYWPEDPPRGSPVHLLPRRLAPSRVAFRLQTEPGPGEGLDESNPAAAFHKLAHGTTLTVRVFLVEGEVRESTLPLAGLAARLGELKSLP